MDVDLVHKKPAYAGFYSNQRKPRTEPLLAESGDEFVD